MPKRVILASKSLSRKTIFDSFGIPYEIIPADIDEKAIKDEDLKIKAEKIARAKAEKIAESEEGIIISADLFDLVEDKVFEKPKDLEEAKYMLKFLSGKKAAAFTGFCYMDKENEIDFSTSTKTEYIFRNLDDAEIEKYVNTFPVTNWAAGFTFLHPYMFTLISYINGSLNGLIYALPTEILIPLLTKSGLEISPKK
ncbi:hypothetical protein C4577_04600 [Candidatus Parcubacteria bacterium]|nr:MAG: hypothetical protein C4577_04600 [Candidatus Parcubacteria bacterium]